MRYATPDDVPAITALINRAYDPVERAFVIGERVTEAGVAAMLAAPGSVILLLERVDQGQSVLVGAVRYKDQDGHGYLGPLAVDPDHQGRGDGRALVEAVEAHCAAQGHHRLELTVLSVRPELLGYYRRLGFTEIGTEPYPEPEVFRVPVHLVRMAKTFTPEPSCEPAPCSPPSP